MDIGSRLIFLEGVARERGLALPRRTKSLLLLAGAARSILTKSILMASRSSLSFCLLLGLWAVPCMADVEDYFVQYCREGKLKEAKAFLEGNPDVLNYQEQMEGRTALMDSCLSGQLESVKWLLEQGADISIGEGMGYTCIHGVGFQGHPELAKWLLANGVYDPQNLPVHEDGHTGFHRACWGKEKRHAETVQAFIDAGVAPK
jgi:hypothetical protein